MMEFYPEKPLVSLSLKTFGEEILILLTFNKLGLDWFSGSLSYYPVNKKATNYLYD